MTFQQQKSKQRFNKFNTNNLEIVNLNTSMYILFEYRPFCKSRVLCECEYDIWYLSRCKAASARLRRAMSGE